MPIPPPFLRRLPLAAIGLAFAPQVAAASAPSPADAADPSVRIDERHSPDPALATPRRPVQVEQEPVADVSSGGVAAIGGLSVEGAEGIPQTAFADVTEKYVGRTLSVEDLRTLADDVARIARDYGYGLASVSVPAQRLDDGVLHVRLDQGRIDRIEATGPAGDQVQKLLQPLADGRPVRKAELERRLLLAQDLPGVELGQPKLEHRAGLNVLTVPTRRTAVRLRVDLDNWGDDSVGPVRARLSVDFNGVLATDDRLTVGGMSTPLQPREFILANASYAKAIGRNGTTIEIGGYYAESRPGAELHDLDLKGKSAEASASISHALVRGRATSIWADASVGILRSSQTQGRVKTRDDHITALQFGLNGAIRVSASSRLRGSLTYRQGLDLIDATPRSDLRRSRPDADGTFSKVEIWLAYDLDLGSDVSLAFRGQGQLASGGLLSAEEMGLGGRYFLRGYDYREYSGDKGIAGSSELRWSPDLAIVPRLSTTFFLYADAGAVGNYRGGYGSGSLASAGGGIRFGLDSRYVLGIEAGIPLVNGADPDGHYRPRVSITLSGDID